MTVYLNNLTGPDGTDVTNENSAAGGDAFNETDQPQRTESGFLRYSTSHGLPALYSTTGPVGGPQRVGWQVNPGNTTASQWGVFYVDPADVVGSNYHPYRGMNASSAGRRMQVLVESNGHITFRDSNNNVLWGTSPNLTSGVRYRVEVMHGGSTNTTGQIKIFEGEGTTPVQDSGLLTGVNFGGPTQSIWFAQTLAAQNNEGKISGRVGWSDEGWIGPDTPTGSTAEIVTHLATGVPTHNSVKVSQLWNSISGKTVRLLASENIALSSPIFSSSVVAGEDGWLSLSVAGLSPDTQYYGGIEVDGEISSEGQFSFRTAPSPGTPSSHTVFFGSCRWNNGGDEAFSAMLTTIAENKSIHGTPAFIADMGDNGYPDWGLSGGSVSQDQVIDHLVSQANFNGIQDALHWIPWNYQIDNHDAGGEGSDKNGSWRSPVTGAIKKVVPHRPLVNSDALYYSIDWGRVRYISVDNRTERDPSATSQSASKRMWSQEQEDWFVDQVRSWPWAICVMGGIYCRQDSSSSSRWGGYSHQFNRIHNRINAIDSLRRLVWIAGDRHALAADLGTSPGTGGVVQAVGAPFEQGSVDLPSGEVWNVGGGTSYWNISPNASMRAFGEASFTDDGGDFIQFDFIGRTADGVERVLMSKYLDVSPRVLWRPR